MTLEEFDKLRRDFGIQKAFKPFITNKIPDISEAILVFKMKDGNNEKTFRYDLLECYPDLFYIVIRDIHNYTLAKKEELDALQLSIKEET